VRLLSAEHAGLISEIELREVAPETRWDRQLAMFEEPVGVIARSIANGPRIPIAILDSTCIPSGVEP
jgi:hypothetical protein